MSDMLLVCDFFNMFMDFSGIASKCHCKYNMTIKAFYLNKSRISTILSDLSLFPFFYQPQH